MCERRRLELSAEERTELEAVPGPNTRRSRCAGRDRRPRHQPLAQLDGGARDLALPAPGAPSVWPRYDPDPRLGQLAAHHHEEIKALATELGIEIINTPTYAPWTNYIEKLWKLLRDDILRLHRLSDSWTELRKRVDRYLASLFRPNAKLLRYVGLSPPLPS